jgi:ABC-type Fe3+-siderophore transport system permease subunit
MIPLFGINLAVIGYLLFSGLKMVPECGAWRWFGIWQLIAAALMSLVVYLAFRIREKQKTLTYTILIFAPFLFGSSLNMIIDLLAWTG